MAAIPPSAERGRTVVAAMIARALAAACLCACAAAGAKSISHAHPATTHPAAKKAAPAAASSRDSAEPSAAAESGDDYLVRAASGGGLALQPPALPDLSGYTTEGAESRITRQPAGRAVVASMLREPPMKEFTGGDERAREWVTRQGTLPRAIYIEDGYVRPRDLARMLDRSVFEQTGDGVYLARLPIVIRPKATLHIDAETHDFRLSAQRGAFLVNDGHLFVTGSRITGWDENANAPQKFVRESQFRPFVTAWGGTETYVVGSRLEGLGYAKSKSSGLTLAQYGTGLVKQMNRAAPRGWILNSEFVGLWYGFSCSQADGVVVRGNTFRDSVRHGIDPQDRSKNVIVAGNTVMGTRERHGIQFSDRVTGSFILDNKVSGSGGSGISIDDHSTGNVVTGNEVSGSAGDGITLFESTGNLVWKNLEAGNQKHGIRLRNSPGNRLYENIMLGNHGAAVYAQVRKQEGPAPALSGGGPSVTIVGGQMVSNGKGPVILDPPLSAVIFDVQILAPQRTTGLHMSGVLGRFQPEVLDILLRQHQAVIVEPRTREKPGG